MKLEEIQELGMAAVFMKKMADSLTDEKLKDRCYRQASLIGDAHDELMGAYHLTVSIDRAATIAVQNMEAAKSAAE